MSGRRTLARDERGATLVEFGLLVFPLVISLTGLLELGYQSYANALLQGALERAARDSAIAAKTPTEIQGDVRKALGPLVGADDVTTTIRSYANYSRIGKAEKVTDDKNGNGRYDPGLSPAECYEDANDNNVYDDKATSGRGNGGNADEVVAYTIDVSYRRILPTAALIGFSPRATLNGTTMLRNQPFARPVALRTVCR